MKTISYLLLAILIPLSVTAAADWPIVAPSTPSTATTAPAPVAANSYWIQGEFTSLCLATVPQYWPATPGTVAFGPPGVYKKFIYTFYQDRVTFRTDIFQDALCNGGGSPLGTAQTQTGFWHVRATSPFSQTAVQINMNFDYCVGQGCGAPIDPNGAFRNQVVVMQFIGNQLFFGAIVYGGQTLLNMEQPLFVKGTEPAGDLAQE